MAIIKFNMNFVRSKAIKFLLFLFVILIPFQDLGLKKTFLRELGASISFLPMLFVILILSLRWLIRAKRFPSMFIYACLYLCILNIFFYIYFDFKFRGIDLLCKGLSTFILQFLLVFPVYLFSKYDSRIFKKIVYFSFFVLILGIFLVDIAMVPCFSNSGLYHAVSFELTNMRPRGFSLEASSLAFTLVTLGFLVLHFLKSKFYSAVFVFFLIILLGFIRSKGVFPAIALSMCLAIVFSKKSYKFKLAIFLVSICFVILYYHHFLNKLLLDITFYTSFGTRFTAIIASVLTCIKYPFGVGSVGFLPAFTEMIPSASNIVSSFVDVNFYEIYSYLDKSKITAINTKSFFFDCLIMYGVPFVLVFMWFHFKIIYKLRELKCSFFLIMLTLYLLVSLMISIPGIGLYSIPLCYGVLLNEIKKNSCNLSRFPFSCKSWRTSRYI
jgi:hypothetical protein